MTDVIVVGGGISGLTTATAGHGGAGVTVAVGCARAAARLVS